MPPGCGWPPDDRARRARGTVRRSRLVVAVVVLTVAAACTGGGGGGDKRSDGRAGEGAATEPRARGGVVRVGVWGDPDPAAPTLNGVAVRALVLPQLFVAQPDGSWRESLVRRRSVRAAPDKLSVSFQLVEGAAWSDGSAITAADLRRSADPRFVAGVDDPSPAGSGVAAGGRITVRFTRPLAEWRRLWSFTDSIAPPAPGVWGGPFVVKGVTPGLETVLAPNPNWRGSPRPVLDEVRLVLVPDSVTARQLLERDELDVISPPAATQRIPQLEAVEGVTVRSTRRSGWWVGLQFNSARVDAPHRRGMAAAFDRDRFPAALLAGEAATLNGFAGPEDATWAGVDAGDSSGLRGRTLQLTITDEEPMSRLLAKAVQTRTQVYGATFDIRFAEAERTEGWVARGEYEAALVMTADPPTPCWTCRFAGAPVEGAADLAAAADAGDATAIATLQGRLRDGDVVVPLWRSFVATAWRTAAADGVVANGYALNAAWNAAAWSHPA